MGESEEQPGRYRAALVNALPILQWLPEYKRSRLRGDVLAGAIVAALLIPQSLGYARIAGVPVQVGLYAVPLALLAYAVLGSSPQLIVGPASTVAIVSGSLVADIARDNPEDTVAITSALAIACGIVLVISGLLRIAWIAEFLSRPIVTGFVFGLTLTIVIGELPSLLGIPKPPGDLLGVLFRTLEHVGDANTWTVAVSAGALALLFGGRQLAPRVPWGLVTLMAGVAASKVFDLAGEGVATIGDVPGGLPPLGLPLIPRDDLGAVLIGGVSLALVALAEGLAATRLFATRGDYRVETERELVGMGAASVAAGFSGGLAVAGSLSKTAAADQAGSRSQVTGLTSAALVVIVLLAFTWFFTDLPQAVLSAIVIAAVWGLMDVAALRRYYRVRRADFTAAAVGIGGVVLFGPLPGLGIAIVVSLLAIIYRSSSPRIEVLGKIGDEKAAWGRLHGHPDRKAVPGIVVARLDAPLFWANATAIEDRLVAEVEKTPGTRALVLDLEATTQLDTTAADVLIHLARELARRDVSLYLARVLHRVEAVLENAGLYTHVGPEHIWHSISQCVRAARRDTGLKAEDKKAAKKASAAADGGADDVRDSPALEPTGEEESFPAESEEVRAGVGADPDAPVEADEGDEVAEGEREADEGDEDDEVDDEVELVEEDDGADSGSYAGAAPIAETKLEHAVNLYLYGMRDGHPRQAIAAYTGDRFVQHRTREDRDVDRFVEFVDDFVERFPTRYIRVIRTIEDGRYVFLHVFQSLNNGESEWVGTGFFDTDADDRIIEHWDVIAPYRESRGARRTPISGPVEITDVELTDENKSLVRHVIERLLAPGGKADRLDDYVAKRCIEHADGQFGLRERAVAKHPSIVYDEIVLLVGQGNFVATLCRSHREGEPYMQVDIFRLEYGRIVEHWENAEPVPPAER